MEKYIGKCLDSLLIPEIDQVEVLVVNDGSKDRSSEIAHEYADRYPQSIRVIDKENGNYGSCINAAMPQCSGRYVKILDADDTFDTIAFSRYVRELPNHEEDVLINDYVMVYEDKSDVLKPSFRQLGYTSGNTYTFDESFRYIISDLHMHCIAYKTSMILSFNYRQSEGISYTDNEWIYGPISIADSFAFIDAGYLYRYLLGRAGQTVDPSLSLQKIHEHFKVIKVEATFFNKNLVSQRRKQYLESRFRAHAFQIYYIGINSKQSNILLQLAEFDKQLKEICPYLYQLLDFVTYAPKVPYRFIKAFRESSDSSKFRVSKFVKAYDTILSILSKIKNTLIRKLSI